MANLLHLGKWRTVQCRRALEASRVTVGINFDRIDFYCDRKSALATAATHEPFIELSCDETRVKRVRYLAAFPPCRA